MDNCVNNLAKLWCGASFSLTVVGTTKSNRSGLNLNRDEKFAFAMTLPHAESRFQRKAIRTSNLNQPFSKTSWNPNMKSVMFVTIAETLVLWSHNASDRKQRDWSSIISLCMWRTLENSVIRGSACLDRFPFLYSTAFLATSIINIISVTCPPSVWLFVTPAFFGQRLLLIHVEKAFLTKYFFL